MQTYVVIFESKNKGAVLRQHIQSFGTYSKITDNAWVVVTSKTASQIRDELLIEKDAADRVFVIRSGAVAAWSNPAGTSEWLKKYL